MKKILKHKYKIVGTVILLSGLFFVGGILLGNRDGNVIAVVDDFKEVEIKSINEIISANESISLIGQVDSDQSVLIKTEYAGVIRNVNSSIGDYVNKGKTLAVFENDDMYANVVQAEAGVRLQEARLNEIKSGARSEEIIVTESKIENTKRNIGSTERTLVETLRDSFIKTDDVMNNKLSALFTGTAGYPQVSFLTNDFRTEIKVEAKKANINRILEDWRIKNEQLDVNTDLNEYTDYVKENLNTISLFLDDLAILVNDLSPNSNLSETTINTYRSNLTASRATIIASVNSVINARTNLDTLKSALSQIEQELSIKKSGGTDNQLEVQMAALEQARGVLLSARAAYNKTFITSPINGRVVTVGIKTGQYMQPSQVAFKVVNNEELFIKTFINTKDLDQISTGNMVGVEGLKERGYISVISPGIDPNTGKVEIEVSIPSAEKQNLTEGEYVNLEVYGARKSSENQSLLLPISAVKSSSSGSSLMIVDNDGLIKEIEVITGKTNGKEVEILSSINVDTKIITNVRGLVSGDRVNLK